MDNKNNNKQSLSDIIADLEKQIKHFEEKLASFKYDLNMFYRNIKAKQEEYYALLDQSVITPELKSQADNLKKEIDEAEAALKNNRYSELLQSLQQKRQTYLQKIAHIKALASLKKPE